MIVSEQRAQGQRGVLIRGIDDQVYFRVYAPDHSFVDYEITHYDCEIEIQDESAALIVTDRGSYLDYTAASLGRQPLVDQ